MNLVIPVNIAINICKCCDFGEFGHFVESCNFWKSGWSSYSNKRFGSGESCNFGEYCDSGNPCVWSWWIRCSSEPGNFGECGGFVDLFDSGESGDFDDSGHSGTTYQYGEFGNCVYSCDSSEWWFWWI